MEEAQAWRARARPAAACLSTNWVSGTTRSDQWGPGPRTLQSYNGPACGPGYYCTRGYAQIQLFNIQTGPIWYGGYASGPTEYADQ